MHRTVSDLASAPAGDPAPAPPPDRVALLVAVTGAGRLVIQYVADTEREAVGCVPLADVARPGLARVARDLARHLRKAAVA